MADSRSWGVIYLRACLLLESDLPTDFLFFLPSFSSSGDFLRNPEDATSLTILTLVALPVLAHFSGFFGGIRFHVLSCPVALSKNRVWQCEILR